MKVSAFLNVWAFLLDIVSWICILASTVGHNWFIFLNDQSKSNPIKLTFGLWQYCESSVGSTNAECTSYDIHARWATVVQIFMISTCFLLGISSMMTLSAFRKTFLTKLSMVIKIISGKFEYYLLNCIIITVLLFTFSFRSSSEFRLPYRTKQCPTKILSTKACIFGLFYWKKGTKFVKVTNIFCPISINIIGSNLEYIYCSRDTNPWD